MAKNRRNVNAPGGESESTDPDINRKNGSGSGSDGGGFDASGLGEFTASQKEITQDFSVIESEPVNIPPEIIPASPALRKATKKEQSQAATVLLALLDGIASLVWGERARMNEFERELIAAPLGRILARVDLAAIEVVNRWTDPLILVMGLTAWMSRITRENRPPRREPPPPPPPPPESEPAPAPEPGAVDWASIMASPLVASQLNLGKIDNG